MKVYLRLQTWVKQNRPLCPVSQLGGTIEVNTGQGEEVLGTWQIPLSFNGMPFLFFDEYGNVVAGEPLPRERVWFLLPMGCYIKPGVRPLEENSAHLSEPYYLQLVNLKAINEDLLCIVDKRV